MWYPYSPWLIILKSYFDIPGLIEIFCLVESTQLGETWDI